MISQNHLRVVFINLFGLFSLTLFLKKNEAQDTRCEAHRKRTNHLFCVDCSSKLNASRLYSEQLKRKQSFFTKETKCRRSAMVKVNKGAGLGHKFSEILFGFLLAHQTNSTFILDDESLYESVGKHGSYEWFKDFLPLDKTEVTLTVLVDAWRSRKTAQL